MTIWGTPVSRDLLANAAAVISLLTALFAAPLLFCCYVVVQRAGVISQLAWFSLVLVLLGGALAAGAVGLILLG